METIGYNILCSRKLAVPLVGFEPGTPLSLSERPTTTPQLPYPQASEFVFTHILTYILKYGTACTCRDGSKVHDFEISRLQYGHLELAFVWSVEEGE